MKGTPHREGRVLTAQGGEPDPGLYVCGWAKRGPSGIIGASCSSAPPFFWALYSAFRPDISCLPDQKRIYVRQPSSLHYLLCMTVKNIIRCKEESNVKKEM